MEIIGKIGRNKFMKIIYATIGKLCFRVLEIEVRKHQHKGRCLKEWRGLLSLLELGSLKLIKTTNPLL